MPARIAAVRFHFSSVWQVLPVRALRWSLRSLRYAFGRYFRSTNSLRRSTTVHPMALAYRPKPVQDLAALSLPILVHVYDVNAGRHDDLLGDDAVTFGITIYRNSWFQLEQAAQAAGWRVSRPEGSLLISGWGYRAHVYRWGQNELVDLEAFRLDEAGSVTKRLIAERNGQLALDLQTRPTPVGEETDLRDLVIVHAGNPDDGCCGVWIGAPVPAEEVTLSPWAWIDPVWTIQRSGAGDESAATSEMVAHDELPEPAVLVSAVANESVREA